MKCRVCNGFSGELSKGIEYLCNECRMLLCLSVLSIEGSKSLCPQRFHQLMKHTHNNLSRASEYLMHAASLINCAQNLYQPK